jgi:hypothetical protein
MTNMILTFPIISRSPLSCTWVQTGNPHQPLICVWLDRRLRRRDRSLREAGASASLGEKELA